MMRETNYRSIAKATSWRIVASISTVAIVYVATGEFKLAFSVGAIEVVVKMTLYYIHERMWQRLKFGLKN